MTIAVTSHLEDHIQTLLHQIFSHCYLHKRKSARVIIHLEKHPLIYTSDMAFGMYLFLVVLFQNNVSDRIIRSWEQEHQVDAVDLVVDLEDVVEEEEVEDEEEVEEEEEVV